MHEEPVKWIRRYDAAIEAFKSEVEQIRDCPDEAWRLYGLAKDRLDRAKTFISNENDKLDEHGGRHGH